MNNYKIINTHTNEIIEALNELGYVWTPKKFDEQDCLLTAHWILATQSSAIAYSSGTIINSSLDFQELTLPQLRDLVVLHRDDVSDATHEDKRGEKIYLTSNKVIYYWQGGWCRSAINKSNDYKEYIANSLKTIQHDQNHSLISGADALRALADGKEIEYINAYGQWDEAAIAIPAMDILDDKFKFRLKPRTVKLEIEVPAPFEPKYGEEYWFVCLNVKDGYASTENQNLTCDRYRIDFGVYRTEAEIKIVVEQYRKIKEHSK